MSKIAMLNRCDMEEILNFKDWSDIQRGRSDVSTFYRIHDFIKIIVDKYNKRFGYEFISFSDVYLVMRSLLLKDNSLSSQSLFKLCKKYIDEYIKTYIIPHPDIRLFFPSTSELTK